MAAGDKLVIDVAFQTPIQNSPRLPLGHRESIKLHVKKMSMGEGWSRMPPKDDGPDNRQPYELD